MPNSLYAGLFRNGWYPLTVLAESPELPKLWFLTAPLATAKEGMKEAWKLFRGFANNILQSSGRFNAFNEVGVYDQTFDPHERLFVILRLLIPLVSLAGSMGLLYCLIGQINPTAKDKRTARKRAREILSYLQVDPIPHLTDYEVCIAVSLVDTTALDTSWTSIGGLDAVISDLKDYVILPFRTVHLLPQSKLFRAPKGVLFYGPPGCGKTLLARATACAANARFFNLQISNLVNMWYGESQKLAEAVFSLAHKLQPAIIFIDEIDSFLTTRSAYDNESTRMMKTQFMALWDGLLSEPQSRIMVIGATNRPGDLDSAILRRLPYKVHVPLPDASQRLHILSLHLHEECLDTSVTPDFLKAFAKRVDGFSGSDLFEICRQAALRSLRTWFHAPPPTKRPSNPNISVEDFEDAFEKFKSNQILDNTILPPLLAMRDEEAD